ncbi:mismatch-specific DNA-glycosylase [Arthrobacter crystallopoietes]|uniref:G/U mismatch-specific uracil-DNA glycosylase n=1 Tax=Crystallibacter crystallopoietes TaxID=37928 RepID=A0A1H1GUY4_9MICC|nr:mismatch-specific DNA-glycosylase [Arthrobacter crystallopoietes]AUI52345.1 mismatch-specific DNA-glycosylase [Arthrobacter crystallopoietes]SDR16951.1 G/U mismatch-specific uracil-DNA glycosylase [Arthrobacter crystallopoietes]
MAFTRTELLGYQNAEVPDLLGPGLRLLFVGINPGLWSAATGTHFARPGNRFYPALAAAGITDRLIRAGEGMTEDDRSHLIARGVGITNVVSRASARADELGRAELQEGALRLADKVAVLGPGVVAVAGITAYRVGFGRPRAQLGRQPEAIGGAELWAVPNPSGLNAHQTVATLAAAYRQPALAAGLVLAGSVQGETPERAF